MRQYFGEPWDAPFIENALRMPTPVGQPCLDCHEFIVQGDQGVLTPTVFTGDDGKPEYGVSAQHHECQLVGVVGHLAGTCYCHKGLGTHRERGRATLAWLNQAKIAIARTKGESS